MVFRILLSLVVASLLTAASVFAAEDLYSCNLELKRPATTSTDSGGFYARAYVEDLTIASGPTKFRWITLTAPKSGVWAKLFPASEEFKYKIQSIQFPQSIPDLGTSYRVGFCYAGPTANTAGGGGSDSSLGSYDFIGTMSTGEVTDDVPYLGAVTGYCDLRSVGASKTARAATEFFPGAIEADMQLSINLGRLSSGEMAFDHPINSYAAQAPRFCKMNIEVTEDSNSERPSQVGTNQAQFMLQIDKNLR